MASQTGNISASTVTLHKCVKP